MWEIFYHFLEAFFTLSFDEGSHVTIPPQGSFLILQFKLQTFQRNLKFTEVSL